MNADNITTGTLDASMVVFPDGSELTTAGIVTTPASSSGTVTVGYTYDSTTSEYVYNPPAVIPGLEWTMDSAGASNAYNIQAVIYYGMSGTANSTPLELFLVVDGNVSSPQSVLSVPVAALSNAGGTAVYFGTVSGLSAGSHTIQLAASLPGTLVDGEPTSSSAVVGVTGSYALCQRVF